MNTKTILVVDDEPAIRHALRRVLTAEGWKVKEAADEVQMMHEIHAGRVDLVTLDLGIGKDGGLQQARELRSKINIPVVIITGKGQPFERAKGLEAGADDYVVKPFDHREVVIRIRRILERYETHGASRAQVNFDHSSVDLNKGIVVHNDGRKEDLTGLEAKLLELFLNRPAQILSRDDINRALHGREWSPYDRTIDGHIARLRRKIEPNRDSPTLIRSVRGIGYVFTVDPTNED